ncbi:hypothetical protein F7725_011406 [Dissostichus mawsoni]|uniref:Uncharacterized protein n=1 Tax=Dissostichus mawsoni TaxID=36200 RepID=A0A7J5Z8Z0_DISMA|nr:hypothetical protein F7725_011406 [Dissostichus mawsoni]
MCHLVTNGWDEAYSRHKVQAQFEVKLSGVEGQGTDKEQQRQDGLIAPDVEGPPTPEDPQEKCQGECAHYTGQKGVAGTITRQLLHRVVGHVGINDDDGAVVVGTYPQPGHTAHLTEANREIHAEYSTKHPTCMQAHAHVEVDFSGLSD